MIDDELALAQERAQTRMLELNRMIEEERLAIIRDYESDITRITATHNKTICPKCNGAGAIERLDAGYMRRFGLQTWDGCNDCGGTREHRGRGYL